MDVRLLTGAIVRQTTVLLAQLATAAGVRAPLAHVANQIFLDLARELEAQGVRRPVVADMFGLALRSYEIKMRRLLDTTAVQRSTWRAVYSRLELESLTRLQLEKAFANTAARDLSALLNDLVDSGLVYRSGTGIGAVFGVTTEADRQLGHIEEEQQTLTNTIWLTLATQGDLSQAQLLDSTRCDEARITAALEDLVVSGRVVSHEADGLRIFQAQDFHIPVGAERGWEAAVCDHFGAVATAIASKLQSPQSRADDTIGGSTLRFTVHAEHSLDREVRALLQKVRSEVTGLW